jgi:hypothetical protein
VSPKEFLAALNGDPKQVYSPSPSAKRGSMFGRIYSIPPVTLTELREKFGNEHSLKIASNITVFFKVDGGMAGISGKGEDNFIREATVLFLPVDPR